MSVYSKLFEIQQNLKAPKERNNEFGGFNYRSCEDILQQVKPILMEQKAIIILSDELAFIGQRYYIKATACLVDIETGEQVKSEAYAREEENKKKMELSQITGSSSSYARKYALSGLFCIDSEKDSDVTNTYGKEENSNQQQTNQQQQKLNKKPCCQKCGREFTGFKSGSGKQHSAEYEYNKRKEKYGKAFCDACLVSEGLKNE